MKLNEHPKCEEIKAELDSGTPPATVAQKYGVNLLSCAGYLGKRDARTKRNSAPSLPSKGWQVKHRTNKKADWATVIGYDMNRQDVIVSRDGHGRKTRISFATLKNYSWRDPSVSKSSSEARIEAQAISKALQSLASRVDALIKGLSTHPATEGGR